MADGMSGTAHDAVPVVALAVSVQLDALNAPVLGDAVKLTVPAGLSGLTAVSVTVAVHVDALPTVNDDGAHDSSVEVVSTVGAATPKTSSMTSL